MELMGEILGHGIIQVRQRQSANGEVVVKVLGSRKGTWASWFATGIGVRT